MPTGYTAKLMDKGQSFQEFVLGCARAFGACIEMRDDSQDKPIPEKFEASTYHQEKLAESVDELKRLQSMGEMERFNVGQELKEKDIASNIEWRDKERKQNDTLKNMRGQVTSWRSPTSDHDGLKKFMLEQLEISMHNEEYVLERVEEAQNKTPEAYFIAALSAANHYVRYHAEELEKENERNDGRNQWIQDLRDSI